MPQFRNALITGAKRGLGLEVARQLGTLGQRVLIGARHIETGVAAAAALREFTSSLARSRAARVVNISSDMGSLVRINNPDPHVYALVGPAYKASKVALNALTALFAKQFKDSPAKVNSASPGWCRTDMGGDGAPLSIAEEADTAVWLATLPDHGPTGQFFSATRKRGALEWCGAA